MRKFLDLLYAVGGYAGAIFLLAIGVLVFAQILARLVDIVIPSADDFARLSLSASSFLALAFTLRRSAHIRVTLILDSLPPRLRHVSELISLTLATVIIGYFALHTILMVRDGIIFPDYTIGQVSIANWIPQIGMASGVVLLFVAFLDDLITVAAGSPASYDRSRMEKQEP